MTMRKISLLLFLMVWSGAAWGQNAEDFLEDPSLALDAARDSYRAGDYKKTIAFVQVYYALSEKTDGNALRSNAESCLALWEEADKYEERGDFSSSSRCYFQILDINRNDTLAVAKLTRQPARGSIRGHDYVDLGLSVLWATCNVGAYSPTGRGSHYAWGETGTKSKYTSSNYKYLRLGKYKKYNFLRSKGKVDWKDTLESSDDVAYEKWGYYWRMPRREEFRELLDNCSLEFTKMEEVFGILFQSKKNGNSIFLPVAGAHLVTVYASDMFMYWSSSLDKTDTEKAYSLFVNFNSDLVFKGFDRDCGMSVRPVADYDPDVRRQLKENVRKLKEEYGF